MANGLVNRIFDYAIAKGWIVPGESVVIDPFGGIGSTGIVGASKGVQVLCCELEQKFVDLAKQNFELHRRTWEACGDPLPVIVQGDSRDLCGVLGPALADCVVGSPPYEGRGTGNASEYTDEEKARKDASRDIMRCKGGKAAEVRYGTSDGQLGDVQGETFWSAAREIVAQCFQILRPGGIAIWVCKDFIRKGQRVTFSADWQRLCVACGFEPVEWIKASLVKETRHPSLFGDDDIVERTERKGFFRRLAEKKGSPPIDEEDVLILRKSQNSS